MGKKKRTPRKTSPLLTASRGRGAAEARASNAVNAGIISSSTCELDLNGPGVGIATGGRTLMRGLIGGCPTPKDERDAIGNVMKHSLPAYRVVETSVSQKESPCRAKRCMQNTYPSTHSPDGDESQTLYHRLSLEWMVYNSIYIRRTSSSEAMSISSTQSDRAQGGKLW
jgi:hypothetical protein